MPGRLRGGLQYETDQLRGVVYVDLLPAGGRAAILAAAGLAVSPGPRSRVNQAGEIRWR